MTDPNECTDDGSTFHLELQYNDHGWGPCELSDTFNNQPYQPFSKSDRMGKISDWTNSAALDKKFPSEYFALRLGRGENVFFLCTPIEVMSINVDRAANDESYLFVRSA